MTFLFDLRWPKSLLAVDMPRSGTRSPAWLIRHPSPFLQHHTAVIRLPLLPSGKRYYGMFSLREYEFRLSALADSFLFRKWLRPSLPPIFFLQGACREKNSAQMWAYAGSGPAYLDLSIQRGFSCPLHPVWPGSLNHHQRSGLAWGDDDELTRSWRAPYSARLRTSASSAFTSVNGAEDKGYEKLPPLDELVQHLCPSTAIGWKAKSAHLSKPCRTTSVFTGRTYFSARQVPSALHSMAVLQIFQTKLLASTDESGPDPVTLRELMNATDLALGHRTLHGESSGARVTLMADLDGDQRRWQGPVLRCTDLSQWSGWASGWGLRLAFHWGTEVVPGHATLPSKAL